MPNLFHRLMLEQGLSQTHNSFVHKDSRGFVWVSSLDGLNRFDGRSVKVYRPNPSNPQALKGNNMQSRFFEAANGDLWFCTVEAINCYRRKTDDFEAFQLRDEAGKPLTEGYYIFHKDPAGNLWICLAGKLYLFDTRTRQHEIKGTLNGVRCFVDTNADGRVRGVYSCYFNSSPGIKYTHLNEEGATTDVDSFFTENDPNNLPPLLVSCIFAESDTLIWLCCGAGLMAFNPQECSYRQYIPLLEKAPSFREMLPLNGGILAVSSTNGGIWQFDKTTRQFVQQITSEPSNPRSLASVECQELNADTDGNFWISHWNTGLSFANLHKQKFVNVSVATASPTLVGQSLKLSGIVEDERGRIWCSTKGSGIFLFNPDGTLAADFSRRRDLPYAQFTHLLKDRSNTIWAVERHHVFRYDAAADRFVEIPKTVKTPELSFAYQTAQGRLLIGTYSGIFEAIKTSCGSRHLVSAAGFEFLKNDMIDWMYEDSNGTLYLGKNATTLLIISKNKHLEFPFGYIKAAYEAPDRRKIWLATTSGLVKMDKNNFTYTLYDESKGLPNQYLYSVIPDSAGFLWLSSNKGILRFNPQDSTTRQYRAADGVWTNEFYSNVWLRHSSGNVWLGNRDVLNVFRPEALRDLAVLPKVQITNMKVNDLDWQGNTYIGECSSLEFPFSENTLSFDFVALEYSDPANNRLKYWLDGYDEQWIELPVGAPGFARYAKLPPGSYTLNIMAANSDGVQNFVPRELHIRIRPPFWQTWWFFLLAGLAVVGAAYSIYKYRLAQIRKEFDFKQKTAESEMKALRAQMNPHFIFNSLNSINAYILRNEGKIASAYLTEFAHLMRQILDYSLLPLIRLEQDIDFLNSYLSIESLRMDGRLTWEIRLEDNLDDFGTEIPPMMLQPFVENAIWHGLSPKPDGGHILLDFKKEGNALICTIKDNGVGRTVTKQKKGHQSKGQSITFERLALYDQQNSTRSDYYTEDLFDTNGQASGTRVTLRLELKTSKRHRSN